MIRIEVVGYRGTSPERPLYAEFGELGGTIGRAEGSALMLSDPARSISRTHASIMWRNDGHVIRNFGTAIPVYLNGRPLVNGEEDRLAAGDEIRIGDYVMRVAVGGVAMPVQESGGAGAASPGPRDDPLNLFGGQADADPFGDLSGAGAAAPGSPPPDTPSAATAPVAVPAFSDIIPPDFDLFAPEPPQSPPLVPSSRLRPDDVLEGLGAVLPPGNIDELFGLDSTESSDPLAPGAPLARSADPLGDFPADPLAALGAVPPKKPSRGGAQRDDASELESAFRPPAARPVPAVEPAPSTAPQAGDVPASGGGGGLTLSWTDRGRGGAADDLISVIVPAPAHARGKDAAPCDESASPSRSHPGAAAAPPRNEPEPAPAADPGPSRGTTAGHDELLHAFLAGAGVPELAIPAGLTPQFMDTLGQLLRLSTQGTLDLLMARALAKREVRADLTMIAARENNPLKFSPGVEAALAHLLAPQGHGFMGPVRAMKDAHDDLRSHQFGFMAGMRAALAGVLERFDPAELERRLTQKTVIDSLIPSHRKAKLWDLFADRYGEISREAEEDFHALFGREFLRAYEAQLARLGRDDDGRQGSR